MLKIYFVEFHYVKYRNHRTTQYFINEICVLDKDNTIYEHGIVYFNTFRWPRLILSADMKFTYEYNRMRCHGLNLSEGNSSRYELIKLWPILKNADIILVRGEEKKKILLKALKTTTTQVINITYAVSELFESYNNFQHLPGYVPYDYLLDTYNKYNLYCDQHKHSTTFQRMCSLRKGFSLREWFVKNYMYDFLKTL